MNKKIDDLAHNSLPILVEVAKNPNEIIHGRFAGKITYGDLAKLIGYTPRGMGKVCGYIRDEITNPLNLPLINCIVVNGKTKYPTEIETGDKKEEAKKKFPIISKAVYSYEHWDELLRKYS